MRNFDRIERYIKNELDENELWEFKKDLMNDPQLAEEFAFMRALHISTQSAEKFELYGTMNNIRHQEEMRGSFLRITKRNLAYAASLLIFITLGLSLWYFSTYTNIDKIYLAYYQPEPVSFAVRSATMSSDQPVMLGLELFEKKNYSEAIQQLSQSPNNPMGRLYNGLAYMELGEFHQAIPQFTFILQQEDNLFTDQAAWYLALCHLKTKNQKELEASLRQIASGHSIYRTKARKLMNELGID